MNTDKKQPEWGENIEYIENVIEKIFCETAEGISAYPEPQLKSTDKTKKTDYPNLEETLKSLGSFSYEKQNNDSTFEVNQNQQATVQSQDSYVTDPQQSSKFNENPEQSRATENLYHTEQEQALSEQTAEENSHSLPGSHHGNNQLNQLRNILGAAPIHRLDDDIAEIEKKIERIEQRLERDYLSNDRLVAFIAKALGFRVAEYREILRTGIAPIIQKVIEEKIAENNQFLSQAMTPAIADVIPEIIRQSSDEITMAISPKMAKALEEQILLDRTAMVKTLSPIIDEVIKDNLDHTQNTSKTSLKKVLILEVMPKVVQALRKVRKDLIQKTIPSQIDTAISSQNFIDVDSLETHLLPIIDGLIQKRIQEDKLSISEVLAPVIAPAISTQITTNPDEIATALSPEIATAIKKKIKQNRSEMVDALYPVIGNTIVQYIAETIREINDKLEQSFSPEGIQRKIRAKMQGISEAELLLKEASPFQVEALFLIENQSGLVISQAQQEEKDNIEADMVAGMLTAIRSFVSEVMLDSTQNFEVHQIDYGDRKILIEVAGSCYLALAIEGEPSKQFIRQMRLTLGRIVEQYSKPIAAFQGNTDTIPQGVHQLLNELIVDRRRISKKKRPPILLIIAIAAIAAIAILCGITYYRDEIDRSIAATTAEALISAPELSVYRLKVEVNRGKMSLTGRVPNQFLRQQAEQIAATVPPPTVELENKIISVQVPPDPVQTAAEVERVQKIFNRQEGISIVANYDMDRVTIAGTVLQQSDAENITKAFAQIPGIHNVLNTVAIEPVKIDIRIYFAASSDKLNPVDMNLKILPIKQVMTRYPDIQLKIVGHSDRRSDSDAYNKLPLQRAEVVKTALESQGISPERLQVAAYPHPPMDVDRLQPLWLSRCVVFYPVSSGLNSQQ